MNRICHLALLLTLLIGGGCDRQEEAADQPAPMAELTEAPARHAHAVVYTEDRTPCANTSPTRMALFGDVHVHTSFSFDAASNTTGATPDDANRFAKGEAIPFWPLDDAGVPAGSIQIDRPLDFLAVTDHGEFLGERALCRTPGSPSYDGPFCTQYRSDQRIGMSMLGQSVIAEPPFRQPAVCGPNGTLCLEWATDPWRRMIEAAEAAYDRSEGCTFTSFVAYEHTGVPNGSNVHHNVIFRTGKVPERPVSFIEAPGDSELWGQLDALCPAEEGCDYLTIPHNSNLANGRMGPYLNMTPTLENRRAYAETRQRREPVMEIFQHKGGSECINGLASVLAEPDELCDQEQVRIFGQQREYSVAQAQPDGSVAAAPVTAITAECAEGEVGAGGMVGAGCVDESDFIRSGLLLGLEEAAATGVNPFKLGMIGATDTHAATPGAATETDWRGHVTGEMSPAERLQTGLLTSNIVGNPGGLAGVWAVENSRDAIFEAMLRREVFGTSGPRIVPRFFAGWSFEPGLCAAPDLAERGYAGGVPMGGDLADPPEGGVPSFVAWAARDPEGGRLQRLQLVKGWIDADGQRRVEVRDIAGSADNGAGVDLTTGERTGDGGEDMLCAVVRDESFTADQSAYWYLRVVENPSARWSHLDCLSIPEAERPAVCSDGSVPAVIQELAWTSPIWFEASAGR